jgi:hypothetical protein
MNDALIFKKIPTILLGFILTKHLGIRVFNKL